MKRGAAPAKAIRTAAARASLVLALAMVSAPSRAEEPLRPPEAPLLDPADALPPTPPEYLSHDAGGIHFHYHPSARERVRILIEDAPAIRATLSELLGTPVLAEVEVRVAVGPGDFARVVPQSAPRGSDVLVLSDRAVLVLSLPGAPVSSSEVSANFRRGLAYLALDEATAQRALPRWFRMGFARHFTGRGQLSRFRALWWASMEQRLVPLSDLDWYLTEPPASDSVPGAQATEFVAFLLDDERRAFPSLVQAVRGGDSFDGALAAAYQRDLPGLERDWRAHLARHKAFLPIAIAGTALWVLIALGVQLRRWRRRKVEKSAEPPRRLVRVRATRERRRPKIELPEPEVPKVSHDGRWHTLH